MPAHGTSPTFIGRAAELDRLEEAFADACAGAATAVLLAGEAGVGKSRLVNELSDRLRAAGARLLIGGAIDIGEGGLPYAPIIEALRPLGDGELREELRTAFGSGIEELAPIVPRIAASESSIALVDGFAQARLFERLLAVLAALAADQPLVVVLEDLHWADRSTRDLLAYWVRNLRSSPVLLVGTYRTDELHSDHPLLPMLAELKRSRQVRSIALPRFSAEEHAAHVAALLGDPAPVEIVQATYARSGGNPFFTEELLADRSSSGDRGELPTTLREVLLARYRTGGPATRAMLRVASVGRRVSHPLLIEVSGMPETTLLEALRDAVDRAIIVANPETARYGFRHALMAEAIYDDLLPGERARLHAAYARTLAERPELADGSPVRAAAEEAHHWLMARELERALPALVAAGNAANAVHAHPEAQRHFETALDLADRLPDALRSAGVDRATLAELAAHASEASGDFPRAIEQWQDAIEHVDAEREPMRAALLWVALGETNCLDGNLGEFVAARRRAVELAPIQPSAERAFVLASLAAALMLSSDLAAARDLAQQAIDVARAVHAVHAEGRASSVLGAVSMLAGEVEQAVGYLRGALDISRSLGNIGEEAKDRTNLAEALHLAGDIKSGITVIAEAIDRVRANGMERTYGEAMTAMAIDLCYLAGEWDRARQLADQARARRPTGMAAAWLNLILAEFEAWQGKFDAAREALDVVAELTRTPRVIGWMGPQEQLAQLALWEGRSADALRQAVDALDALDADGAALELRDRRWLCLSGLWAAADLADEARARQDEAGAAQAVKDADELGARFAAHVRASPARAASHDPHFVVDTLLADAEIRRAHGRSDPELWARVAEHWERLDHVPDAAVARWREAEARLVHGRSRSAAAEPLRAAAATARRICARPLLERIESLARRARIELPGDDVAAPNAASLPANLTPREREVLGLLAEGLGNAEIGRRLFISDKTASVHVANIKGKLGVTSRIGAATVAVRHGLGDAHRSTAADRSARSRDA